MSAQDPAKSITYSRNEKERPTTYLLQAIADHDEREINELPPIHKYVNPEALNELFDPSRPYSPGLKNGKLDFEYSNYKITFHSEGTIEFYER